LIDWGGAQRWLAGQHDGDELENIAVSYGGEVTRNRGGDRNSEGLPSLSGSKRALLTRMKQAFDPAGVFNPGRLYSWM
jgi:glycolate oxidase FAD binding subunit